MPSRQPPAEPELLAEELEFDLHELASLSGVETHLIIEMVGHAILEPLGSDSADWRFPAPTLPRVRRALRLRRDLDLNWPGVCLAIELLDELAELRRRQRALLRRLGSAPG